MIRQFIAATMAWLKRVITQPREELSRWQRAARFAYDLFRFGGRQLATDRAPQMAAALAYRTLFALVPVLVVGTLIVRGLRGTDAFLRVTQEYWTSLGLNQIHLSAEGADPASAASLADWLQGLVRQSTQVNVAAIGWAGMAVIVYAAISMMVEIENGFNTIYRAPRGRPWTRRVPLYWFALTVYPLAIGLAWYANNKVEEIIASMPTGSFSLSVASFLWSLGITWLVLLTVYTQLPNTSVRVKYAAVGALVAAVLLQVGQHSLNLYLNNALSVNLLFGTLGLVPLFTLWVYLMWLALLFGLEVSAILQGLRGRELEELERTKAARADGCFEPEAVVAAMEIVAQDFAAGRTTAVQQIAEECGLAEATAEHIVARLVSGGLVHWVSGDQSAVTLARPAEKVAADELLEIGFEISDQSGLGRRSALAEKLREVQSEVAAGITLAGLAGQGKAAGGTHP